jgi:hypothetical protein
LPLFHFNFPFSSSHYFLYNENMKRYFFRGHNSNENNVYKKIMDVSFWSPAMAGIESLKLSFKSRPLLLISSLILIILIPVFILTSKYLNPKSEAAWFDEGFQYRKAVDIANTSGGNLTDFQVSISIGTGAPIAAGKMKSDCSDIRITDQNGKSLPYWVETNGLNSCNQNATIIWVKVPEISTSGATLYVYYGNPSATSLSNGSSVFVYFDDFNNASIDTNKWNQSGGMFSISNGRLRSDRANGTGSIFSKTNLPRPFVLDMDFYPTQYPSGWEGGYHNSMYFGTYNTSYVVEHGWIPHGGGGNSFDGLCDDGGCYHGQYVNPVTVGNSLYKISMQIKPMQAGPQGVMTYTNRRDDGTGSQANDTVYTGATTGNDPLYIGASDTGGNVSDDFEWDNWRIRKYASTNPTTNLSVTEEKSLGPVAYWKFDEGVGSTAYDSTTNRNNGTITGATWQSEDLCLSGKCLLFNGQTNYVDSNYKFSLSYSSSSSFSVWIKPSTIDTGGKVKSIIGKNNYEYILAQEDQKIRFIQWNPAGSDALNFTTDNFIQSGKWYYITFVYDGTQNKGYLYVNGILKVSQNTLQTSFISQNESLKIGKGYAWSGSTTPLFNGLIDDVKVYNSLRTISQITTDYAAGLARQSSAKGTSVSMGSPGASNLSNGLVGYWKMDEASAGTGSTAYDASGNNNNGTGTGTSVVNGKFGNGRSFNGSGNRIETSLAFTNPSSLTYSTWVKTNSTGTKQWIICPDNNGYDWSLLLENGKVALMTGLDYWDSTYSITTEWTHIVVVFDYQTDRKAKLYVNGALISNSASLGPTNTGPITIGNYYGAAYDTPFSGVVDETRIYNRALSPKEVADLYNFAPGLVGYWDFEEGNGLIAKDKSGNSINGDLHNSVSWSSGKYGKGINLVSNASLNNITTSSSTNLGSSGGLTLEAWVNPTSYSAEEMTVIQGLSSSYYLSVYRDGSINCYWYGTSSPGYHSSGVGTVPLNAWTHITCAWDGTNIRLYTNGILKNTAATSGDGNDSSSINIGAEDTGRQFRGNIDEVKIYNYARTSHQVIEDMNGGHPLGGSPVGSQVGYWKFDEGYGTTTNNAGSGGQSMNGSIAGAAWSNNGKFGKALNFLNTNDKVDFGSPILTGTGDFTITSWLNTSNAPGTNSIVSNYGGSTCSSGLEFYVSGNKLGTYINGGYLWGAIPINSNTWYHVVTMRTNGIVSIYVNGKLDTSGSVPNTIGANCNLTVGNGPNYTSERFVGLIDEVKIYNAALSDEEIKIDYNRGQAMQMGTLSSGTGNTAPSNAASQEYCVPGDSVTCLPPVGEWKFEEGVGSTVANDSTGNNNKGTFGAGNAAPIWTEGKNGAGLKFDGNDSITTGITNFPAGSSDRTVEIWFNTTANLASNVWGSIFSYGTINSNQAYIVAISSSQDSDCLIANSFSVSQWGDAVCGTTSLNDGKWHHGAVTSSGNTYNLYVDGKFQKTGTMATNTVITSSYIGNGMGGSFYTGQMDGVKIYNYARTPSQIAWDYNKGGPVGWWRMDECQGDVIHDVTGNGNNGTWYGTGGGTQTSVGNCNTSGTAWYNGKAGKQNYSLNFDGADDYINIPDPSNGSLDFSTGPMSISFFTKTNASGYKVFLDKNWGLSGGPGYLVATVYPGGNTLFWAIGNGSNLCGVGSNKIINDNVWHGIVLTLSRGVSNDLLSIYIDGKLDSTNQCTAGFNINSSQPINIARGLYGSDNISGQIDDFKIYNYSLTADQVKSLYNGGAINFGPSSGAP